MGQSNHKPSEPEIADCQTVSALQRALDRKYRELLETAKTDWQRLFGELDPRARSTSVRVSTPEPNHSVPGFGWLKTKKKAARDSHGELPVPRMAR